MRAPGARCSSCGRAKGPSSRSGGSRSRCFACCRRKRRPSFPISRSTRPRIAARRRASRTTKSERATRRENFFSRRLFSHCAKKPGSLSSPHFHNGVRLARLRVTEVAAPAIAGFHSRDGMTRIGFAYNQKPEPEAADAAAELSRADDEPPSSAGGALAAVAALIAPAPDDEFAEWDSIETIDAVAGALARHGEVIRLEARDDFPERLRAERPDIVFNIAEGLRGPNREAHVPAICEFYGVPYSGSDPFTLALCLDKARTKEILRANDVPTADWFVVASASELSAVDLGTRRFPLFAKPIHEGSSKGITERNFVANAAELAALVPELLERYQQPVIVEAFLPGAEFTCGVLGNGAGARVLPIVGMNFAALPDGALPIYGYEAKWIWDTPSDPLDIFECPARIDPRLQAAIEDVVL